MFMFIFIFVLSLSDYLSHSLIFWKMDATCVYVFWEGFESNMSEIVSESVNVVAMCTLDI